MLLALSLIALLCGTARAFAAPGWAYPEAIASWDEAEKQRQHAAADGMITGLRTAAARGEREFRIAPGDYRIGAGRWRNLMITATNLSIAAEGATLWYNGRLRTDAVLFRNCSQVSLRGLTMDCDPLHYSQGEVVAIDPAAKTFDIRIDPEFPPIDGWDTGGNIKTVFFAPEGRMREQRMDWVGGIDRAGEGVYRIRTKLGVMFKYDNDPACVGDRFVLPDRSMRHAIAVDRCAGVKLDDLTIYGSPHMAIAETGGDGGHVYRNIRVIRRPGTRRLIACNADIFHSAKVRLGPRIEGCEFSWSCDDAINVHSFYSVVMGDAAGPRVRVLSYFADDIAVGARLEFLKFPGMQSLGGAIVKGAAPVRDPAVIEDGKRIPAQVTAMGHRATEFSGSAFFPYDVELDHPLPLARFDLAVSYERAARGTIIRSNHIHDIWTRGILVKAVDFTVEENRIERTGMCGILLAPDTYFWEAPFPRRGRIVGNTLADCGFSVLSRIWLSGGHANIGAFVEGPAQPFLTNGIFLSDITIEGNRIVRPAVTGIFIANASNVTVRGNTIESPCAKGPLREARPDLKSATAAIHVTGSKDVTVEGNRVLSPGPACRHEVLLQD